MNFCMFRFRYAWLSVVFAIVLLVGCSEDSGQTVARWSVDYETQRTGATVLRIAGLEAPDEEVFLTLDQLLSLPQQSFESTDPWYDRTAEFHGVSLYRLLYSLGLPSDATSVVFHATNDYEIEVELSDVRTYDYLVAVGEDGKLYSELPRDRNRGTAAIAIDFDTYDQLDVEIYKYHLAWWLDSIEIGGTAE